jgi:prepilin-type N-terminal cleavage/methylation domain-containing protein
MKYIYSEQLKGSNKNNGFSLVELSIVLVILGLLVGGVLTGKSLIRAAELRAVTTEFAAYQAAILTFKDKYQAIPGDMSNATRFWGKLAAYCNADAGTASATGTCNGNGDGLIWLGAGANSPGENFMIWNQLALSGLITGTYTGISGSVDMWSAVYGENVPISRLPNTVWNFWSADLTGGSNPFHYKYNNRNVLEFSMNSMNPAEAWAIDKKMDDGLPAKGNVHGTKWNDECASADDGSSAWDDFNASYRVTDTSNQCGFLFRNIF